MGYSPCLECYKQYGRGYRETCNQICDYAVCQQQLNALMIERRDALVALEQLDQSVEKNGQLVAELVDQNRRLLKLLHGKEEISDGK